MGRHDTPGCPGTCRRARPCLETQTPIPSSEETPSLVVLSTFCANSSLRLDAGMDVYSPFYQALHLSPRWGAGFAYRAHPFVATLEVAGARYAKTLSSESELQHSVGGSLRLVTDRACSLQPGISLSIPLEDRIKRWFLGFDLALRF